MNSNLTSRSFQSSDRRALQHLLSDLGEKYFNGDRWLSRKLDASMSGAVETTIYEYRKHLAGITIVTSKGASEAKLSTFKVAERFRGIGVGSHMMAKLESAWLSNSIRKAWVTVDEYDNSTVGFFNQFESWSPSGQVQKVYRPNSADRVFLWSSEKGYSRIERLNTSKLLTRASYESQPLATPSMSVATSAAS